MVEKYYIWPTQWEAEMRQATPVRRGGDLSDHTHPSDIRSCSFDFKEIVVLFVFKTLERDFCEVKPTTEGSPSFCSTRRPQ